MNSYRGRPASRVDLYSISMDFRSKALPVVPARSLPARPGPAFVASKRPARPMGHRGLLWPGRGYAADARPFPLPGACGDRAMGTRSRSPCACRRGRPAERCSRRSGFEVYPGDSTERPALLARRSHVVHELAHGLLGGRGMDGRDDRMALAHQREHRLGVVTESSPQTTNSGVNRTIESRISFSRWRWRRGCEAPSGERGSMRNGDFARILDRDDARLSSISLMTWFTKVVFPVLVAPDTSIDWYLSIAWPSFYGLSSERSAHTIPAARPSS